MKQADLRVGDEYALPTYKPYDAAPLAARVRILSIDGGGKVTVQVVNPGTNPPKNAWDARPVKRNEQRQVATRDIVCPWAEWADRAASIGAEREAKAAERRAWHDEYKRRRTDRLFVDPERALPEEYDEEDFDVERDIEERAALCEAYIKARGLGPYATVDELKPLLVDLPVPVLRDILATEAHQPGAPGTVASTFVRAAKLLEVARIASRDRQGRPPRALPQPGDLLGESDIAFVNAVRDSVTASGGELLLPPVPALPEWVDEEDRAVAPLLGWLRLAVGDTSGERLHSPGCYSVQSRPVLLTEHMPWWLVMLEGWRRLCGRCGGPSVRDLLPLAGFVAAVDVWRDRGRNRIERWQQAAFQRLLVASAAARAQMMEPDITLAWRIVAALIENAPAEEGWAAYTVVTATDWNYKRKELEKLTPQQREAARALVRDRLSTLESALPPSQRPLPLPQAVDAKVLGQRYRHLHKLLEDSVPQLDRLLFTLPGAV
ncbi:hypothetical protein [Actinoallomurus soli]|uniref:hypothetical protein n=1 Tax=Actinoallomurus soli TaxID=2952535 RepID=UPI002091EDBD|nr:hypothetical protein [Actinoallomurus soli]MCO5974646.1 hypothetical protein [Actinoallomurus soli]